ncbi:spermidine/putrescine ABC transporter permease protein [Vagococcus lutrae]|uniref:ABC transporter permease n=1 Tax=Vagococcus lutrae TaxID=81947 RepID=UPI0019259F84|nr:ABC transporter permease subunit [Vagococcus lutrae]GEQ60844.1 spermidine/putrescine ABC transporter permease protein [Vagococcus lutrae]GEQ62738.1 spermidine/putrescine ABC transporter permease protein [Vagococcus lutrae]GEQ64484.1 spermidine/putrescine ABC transporter permease protein [Vagococcus lutrae]
MKYLNPKRLYHTLGKKTFLNLMILITFLLFFYAPLLNTLMLAFADQYQVPHVLPTKFGFEWWKYVFSQDNLIQSIVNSFIIAVLATCLSMLICIPAAYAMARFDFKGKNFFMFSFLLSNSFPKIGLYTALGILFYKFHLMGTLTGVIIVHILNTMIFMIWIPSSSFKKVRIQQEEAARDVGAGPMRTFLKITLPSAVPGIAVAGMYTFLGSLEEAQGTLLVGFPEIKTMATSMYSVILDYPPMAGAVFSLILVIPTIILLWICRKVFGKDIFSGGMSL